MRQAQVTAPEGFEDEVEEVLEEYSHDVTSNEVDTDGDEAVEFTATVEAGDIDELTEELKGIKEIEKGDLSIRVLQQESLIEKGQKTVGSASTLSQEEIYSRAQQFSSFTRPEWGLIGLSSAIAAYGLMIDNLIIVIGAMMLAPILSPFVSGALSLAVGDRKLMTESIKNGFHSVLIAIAVSFVAVLPFNVSAGSAIDLVVSPGVPTVILSFLVGAAAALTYATGQREQVAGVAVAIALVPPLAATGIALKMQEAYLAFQAASVAFINILAVIVAGFLSFRLIGLKPSTYYKKKKAEEIRYVVPAALVVLVLIAAPVSYLSYQNLETDSMRQQVEDQSHEFFGDDLLDVRFHDSSAKVIVIGEHNVTEFQSGLPEGIKVRVVELKESG